MKTMKKKDTLTLQNIKYFDYKDLELLRMFISPYGSIVNKKRSGLTAKQHRLLATAIKQARYMGLLPYVSS